MRFAAAVIGVLLGFAPGAQAQTLKDLIDQFTVKWNAPTEPFTIIDNVHYVGTNGLASYLITTAQGHVLVDTALAEANPQIKASIAKLGFKVADIKFLLNSHAHLDHAAGLAELKQETGAQVVAGERDKPLLEGGYYPGQESAQELKFPPVKVDRTVKDGDTVQVGDLVMTAHATPGHSPGCTSWAFKVKDNGAERTALIFCSGTVALNKLVGSPTYPGIVEDYKRTFAWARGMKVDVFLAPHPEMYGMPDKRKLIAQGAPNPFVKVGEFNTYVEGLEKAFNEALVKQEAEAKGK
jgi:metallo-beta-lactamase class B